MFAVVFFVFIAAGGVWLAHKTRDARLRVVEEAFRSLGCEPERGRGGVEGRVKGHVLVFGSEARSRNMPAREARRTWCRVELPAALPPFEMDLRPETRTEVRQVEHGLAIDLIVGDAAFDESFIVEAAPAEMAKALLDEPARTGLLAFHPCRMTIADGELRFSKGAALDEYAEVRRVLELCSHVVSRLQSLPAQFHERRLALAQGGELAGYRGPSPEAMRALITAPDAATEIAQLHRVRSRRLRARATLALAVIALGVAAYLWLLNRH
jgi:hypothetical protein